MGLEYQDTEKLNANCVRNAVQPCCKYRVQAYEIAEKTIGQNKYDDNDIGMLLEGYSTEKFTGNKITFAKYAEKWFTRMKNEPAKYEEYKNYNWGSIDYLIRLSIKMYGMNETCDTYGEQIKDVYFVEDWSETGKGWEA